MGKKYRLEIIYPVSKEDFSMAEWIRSIELDGQKCILKDDHYEFDTIDGGPSIGPAIHIDNVNAAWLTEIKEPLTVKEWHEENKENLEKISANPDFAPSIQAVGFIWNAALENQKLGVVVDEAKDREACENWLHANGIAEFKSVSGKAGQCPDPSEFWKVALSYARGQKC